MRMQAFRFLCALLGGLFVLGGLFFVVAFFRSLLPGATSPGVLPLGPGGLYFMALGGTALLGWGGGLLGAFRHPASHRILGTWTALALGVAAVVRMVAWWSGDYASLGSLLRIEAGLMLVLALALVWLRPPRRAA